MTKSAEGGDPFDSRSLRIHHRYQAAEIEGKLHAKHGKDFTVTAIGDRIGKDSVTAYCSPSDDMGLVFEARMNNSDSSLFDSYVPRLIGRDRHNRI